MPDFLTAPFAGGLPMAPAEVGLRLLAALVLGVVVAWIYRRTRAEADISPTFPATLVLLSILIAMVTQVIGDNVARAFSLVGALSIVRFRTVVRDTQDTAFVIFGVVVGMAVGAGNLVVALIGIVVVTAAAFLMRARPAAGGPAAAPDFPFVLTVRAGLGQNMEAVLNAADPHLLKRTLLSMSTAKQGLSVEASYEARLRTSGSAEEIVKTLNRIEGVQGVELTRRAPAEN